MEGVWGRGAVHGRRESEGSTVPTCDRAILDFQYTSTFKKKPEEFNLNPPPIPDTPPLIFPPTKLFFFFGLLLTPCPFGHVRRGKTTGE